MHTASRHSGRVREYLASLERDEQVRCAAMEWVDVDERHTGRVVLIGDAAHAGSPPMGQAGCMAMEDARASRQKCRARQRRWREC